MARVEARNPRMLTNLPFARKSKYLRFNHGRIMKWQICISIASLPLAYSLLLLGYYVEKYLHETNPKQMVRRYRELF